MIGNFEVYSTGSLTIVDVEFNGVWARGSAKLHPDDVYDYNIGFNLAYARAIERLGAKLRKRTMKIVDGKSMWNLM